MAERKVTAMSMINGLLAKSYKEAWEAKAKGIPVGWSSSVFPQEIVETFGLPVLYPENQAAGNAAKREAVDLQQKAEARGYSVDLCAYARTNFGMLENGGCYNLNMPKPDFVCCCNKICNELIKWYEALARDLNIPLIMIDTAFNDADEITEDRVEYFKGQFEEAIRQLEEISGKKFDQAKLEEVMEISAENGRLWRESMMLSKDVFPAPMNGFDLFSYMAVIVCYRGKRETTEAFQLLISELKEHIKNGTTSNRMEEKYRIMMEGIPCWPSIGYKMKTFGKYGVNMTGSVYPHAWALIYDKGDLAGLAKAYSSMFNNVNTHVMAKYRVNALKDGNCEGVFYHMNRSCKLMSFVQYQMAREIEKETGLPYASFDGDQADPRGFSQAQFETRLQGLVEVMEQRKAAKGGN